MSIQIFNGPVSQGGSIVAYNAGTVAESVSVSLSNVGDVAAPVKVTVLSTASTPVSQSLNPETLGVAPAAVQSLSLTPGQALLITTSGAAVQATVTAANP